VTGYGPTFAKVHDRRWSGFTTGVAPVIRELYETTVGERGAGRVLDLCCGTGPLALHFLSHGYRVVGLDLSRGRLELAEKKARAYAEDGRPTASAAPYPRAISRRTVCRHRVRSHGW
jgi:ubiquinone/menaquinone biosynthesis C-methylase UbiE